MSSPWAKISTPEPSSLQEIMSEEVAKELQEQEDKKYVKYVINQAEASTNNNAEALTDIVPEDDSDLESDAVIARMLQKQFDQEYDDILKRTEDKFNGASKVSISFSNYRRAPQSLGILDSIEFEPCVIDSKVHNDVEDSSTGFNLYLTLRGAVAWTSRYWQNAFAYSLLAVPAVAALLLDGRISSTK